MEQETNQQPQQEENSMEQEQTEKQKKQNRKPSMGQRPAKEAKGGHYKSLPQAMADLKRPFVLIATLGIILQTSVLIGGFALIAPSDAREYDTLEICHYGMKAIFEKSDDGELLDESVLEDIKNLNFDFHRILSVKYKNSTNCTVSARFGDGIHHYRVKLEKSPRFKRGVRILDARGGK